jgi:hypothetical protein
MRRQLALVRARMPMKAGVKIPRAKMVVRIAIYIWFSFPARQPCAALVPFVGVGGGVSISGGGDEILTRPSRSLVNRRGPVEVCAPLFGCVVPRATQVSTDRIADWFPKFHLNRTDGSIKEQFF